MNIKRVLAVVLCVAAVLSATSCAVIRYGNAPEVYGFAYSTEFFGKEETLPEEYKNAAATITMCKNEREIAYVAISDAEKELTGVKFSFGEFSDGEHIFPADKIEGYKMSYAEKFSNEKQAYYTEPFGYIPLNDFTNNSKVASAENQAYALRFETSADTPAGIYRGTAAIEYDGGKKDIEVVVKVLDITLPETKSYETNFGSWLPSSRYYYEGYMTAEEMDKVFLDFAEEQRIPVAGGIWNRIFKYPTDGLTGMKAWARQCKYYLEDHPNSPHLHAICWSWWMDTTTPTEELDIRKYTQMTEFYEAVVAEGIEDHFVYYPLDEPEKNEWVRNRAKEVLRQFKEYYPEIRVILTASPVEKFYADEASLFVPFFYSELAEDYADFGEGKPLWVYFLAERAASGWYSAMIGASGYLQWEYGLLCAYNEEENAYNKELTTEEIWNGLGGKFVLPGRIDDGIVNENRGVTTTCAEGIRDAAEEYEKLLIFKEKAKAFYDGLGITEYTFEDAVRSIYANVIDTHTYNNDEIPADIFDLMQKEIYSDILSGMNSFTVISENRTEANPNGVTVEVFTRKGATVALDGRAADETFDFGSYEKHVFNDSASKGLERHTVTVDGRDFVKTYRMSILEQKMAVLDIENDFDAIKAAILKNTKSNISGDRIEKVEINGKTAMKITFLSASEKIVLSGGDLANASWGDYTSFIVNFEKGEGCERAKLSAGFVFKRATNPVVMDSKVYYQHNKTVTASLPGDAISAAKKSPVTRLTISTDAATTVYITDVSVGK